MTVAAAVERIVGRNLPIAHQYDVSNALYRLVLGPSMTYSFTVWPSVDASLEEAQAANECFPRPRSRSRGGIDSLAEDVLAEDVLRLRHSMAAHAATRMPSLNQSGRGRQLAEHIGLVNAV